QEVRGFLHGDIAEVLLFNKVLSDAETKSVRTYLDEKHSKLKEALPLDLKLAGTADNSEPLVPVKDPPPIQMLVPGFSVYELPVELTNINNVRYRADGKMYALGYNGNIWLLSDSDGDGFEDKADLFFDNQSKGGGVPALRGPIGMAVIPDGHALLKSQEQRDESREPGKKPDKSADAGSRLSAHNSRLSQGVVVPSKGKVSAVIDWDGDGRADEEKIIASGWKEIAQNVDAIGVAIDSAGAIYFGLGTEAYNNAYLIDDQGKAHYDLNSDHGTIQRIAPDLSKRSTVCTGVRFTIGMEFDEHSELFVTDQEGATWLPNGNPFDELLHIPTTGDETKRHYGFPPRHPKHLPNVIDEPSLFDYGPQHQSTCGMAFNLPWKGRALKVEGRGSEKKQTADESPASDLQPSTIDHRPIFGPEDWRGNVFVTGESRGKLYRTELTKTESVGQYVARNQLIACLSLLTVDCCVSPRGDLVVACHSGGPDWGTGPTGKGKLFVIRHTDKKPPQPIAAWTAGPQEVRVTFDRPLDPVHLKNLTAQTKITYGEFVAAGDRFETLRPGYAVVQRQVASPRYNLPVHGVSVTPDRRTLLIATAPHRAAVQYALTLPGLGRSTGSLPVSDPSARVKNEKPEAGSPGYELPQHPQIDLAYSLNGVLATWEPEDKTQRGWSGVLPHLDLKICNEFSTEDADNDRFHEILKQKGTLTLETQLDLRNLLHPAVQPGSKLDHEWPDEPIRVNFTMRGARSLKWTVGEKTREKILGGEGLVGFAPEFTNTADVLPRIKLVFQTGEPGIESQSVEWFRSADVSGGLELPLNRFLLPWAEMKPTDDASTQQRDIPELAGGSWGRGRRVFFSDEAGCAKCHVAHGAGSVIGPDLSNLIHRDHDSVLRDVTLPSFAINPDFLASVVTLKNGRVLTGIVRSAGEVDGRGLRVDGQKGPPQNSVPQPSTIDPQHFLIGDKDGKVHAVARGDIDEMLHSPLSIMPEGMPQKLGPERMRDLLTFLLTEPPHMPSDAMQPPPKPRTRAEVAKVLGQSRETRAESREPEKTESNSSGSRLSSLRSRPLRVLLVAGAKDHGPGEHDYPAWLKAWSELLRGAEGVTVETAMEWPSPEQLAAADTIAFFQKGVWNSERALAIDAHLAKGGGLVYIHWAVEAGAEAPAFAQRIGLASNAAKLKFRHGPLDLGFESGKDHPIGRNFDSVHFHDESYWQMQGDPSKIKLIASGIEDGEPRPLFWTLEPSKGRVFVSILGHYSWTFDDPLFRILLLRGIAWSAKEPVDRFNELATIGVKLAE
ncbi:MAG: ThuA domain-containing protein, partial [Candidatus Saccharimonas sp.]|nr:ThuA domain-containing protein [Planctomycetaceae bacterium]